MSRGCSACPEGIAHIQGFKHMYSPTALRHSKLYCAAVLVLIAWYKHEAPNQLQAQTKDLRQYQIHLPPVAA